MYKRHIVGETTHGLGGVVSFFIFCVLVVWLVPAVVEAVSGMPVELFMMPPVWRADIMCAGPDHAGDAPYTYVVAGDSCIKRCRVPGCGMEGQATPIDPALVAANMERARAGLDLLDLYELALDALRYGAITAVVASIGVLGVARRPRRVWPLGMAAAAVAAGAAATIMWAVPPYLGVAAWVVSYGVDMWSTRRFGERDIIRFEWNPLLRWLCRRYGLRTACTLHTTIYGVLLAGAAATFGAVGPIPWDVLLGVMSFMLAAAHILAGANNIREYGCCKS